ncbi:hypothetical protein ACLBXP_26045, partial [Methylobacterium sp. A54F]
MPGDLVGVVAEWSLPTLSDALQPGGVRKVQGAIAGGTWADDVRAGNWAGKVVASVLGLDASDQSDRKRISKHLAMWKRNGCLKTESHR